MNARRIGVLRTIVVSIELHPDAFPDMTSPYGRRVFAPRAMRVSYVHTENALGAVGWRGQGITVTGPQRLKSGGVSERVSLEAHYSSARDLPDGWFEIIAANLPNDVDETELPIERSFAFDDETDPTDLDETSDR